MNGILTGALFGIIIIAAIIALNIVRWVLSLRRVVPTDQVHIVQSGSQTVSYGSSQTGGNVYYSWPAWLPKFGVTVKAFSVSNFEVRLTGYKTYDKGRLPLRMDLSAFFRIENTNLAAQRVSSQQELYNQLKSILESVARAVISNFSVEELLEARAELGDKFTSEIKKHLAEGWGVVTTKNIEISDLDDAEESEVIHNITAKKDSEIAMESRIVVAENMKRAEEAEIEAQRSIELKKTEASQITGERKIEAQRLVDLKNQEATQQVQEAAKLTKEKEMAVAEVANVRTAEINQKVKLIQAEEAKKAAEIKAEQDKIVAETKAEADKSVKVKFAEAQLEETKKRAEGIKSEQSARAEGIKAVGEAEADAKTKMELAPVTAQTTLAKEIGANKEYQQYLITVEQVKANASVGIAQAEALKAAKIQVIANAGDVSSGITSALDIVSAKGGTQIGTMLQAFGNTPVGKEILNTVGISTEKES